MKMPFAAAIGLVAFLCVYVSAETCPPESQTRPCECLPEFELTLECRKITDASDLDGVSRRTGDVTFNKLRLFNSSIDSIPSNLLMQKQFESIEIYDSRLYSLFDSVDESNKVRSVDLLNVEFGHTFPWRQFEPLNLTSLRAVHTFIPELGTEFKDNVSKQLRYLILSRTHTIYISDGIFVEYKDLKEVTIKNCGLKDLRRSYFSRPAAELFLLNFEGNSINVLPDDFFEEMPNLLVVNFIGNKLTTIAETVLQALDHQLSTFRLEKNPLSCDCNLKWVVSSYTESYGVFGKCESGFEELKHKELETLKPEDFESCK